MFPNFMVSNIAFVVLPVGAPDFGGIAVGIIAIVGIDVVFVAYTYPF